MTQRRRTATKAPKGALPKQRKKSPEPEANDHRERFERLLDDAVLTPERSDNAKECDMKSGTKGE